MSDYKFDPVTGKPITDQGNSGFKFDPMTGKPINPSPVEGPKFDPFTGKPIEQPKAEGPKFDPLTGKPLDQNISQNIYGSQNNAAPYYYDPIGLEKAQNAKNKKVAVVVLVLIILAFLGLGIFGVFKAAQMIKNNVNNEHTEVITDDDKTSENNKDSADEPAPVPAEDPVQQSLGESAEDPATKEPVEEQTTEEQVTEEQVAEEKPAEEPAADQMDKPNTNAVSQGLQDVDPDDLFSFAIGDKNYKVPMKVSVLLEEGWSFDNPNEATSMLGSGETAYCYLTLPYGEKRHFAVDIMNFSIDARQTQDCYVIGITWYDYNTKDTGMDFSIRSGKLKVGSSSPDDVKSVMGEPDKINDSFDEPIYYYYKDGNDENYDCKINIAFEENVISYISFRNTTEPDDIGQEEVSDEAPDYLNNYVAPSGLGTDPLKGNFQLDGVAYILPVPLRVFSDNGWKYDVEDEYTVGAGKGYVITMYKGDSRVTITVFNFDEKATYLKNTIVTSVSAYNSHSLKNDIEFPDGLKPGMTEADLLKWLNKHNIKNYAYSTSTGIYKIPLDQSAEADYASNRYYINVSDGVVDDIDLTNYGWLSQN